MTAIAWAIVVAAFISLPDGSAKGVEGMVAWMFVIAVAMLFACTFKELAR